MCRGKDFNVKLLSCARTIILVFGCWSGFTTSSFGRNQLPTWMTGDLVARRIAASAQLLLDSPQSYPI